MRRTLARSVSNSAEYAVGRAVAHFVLQSGIKDTGISGYSAGEHAAGLAGIDILQSGGIECHIALLTGHIIGTGWIIRSRSILSANGSSAAVRRRASLGYKVSRSIVGGVTRRVVRIGSIGRQHRSTYRAAWRRRGNGGSVGAGRDRRVGVGIVGVLVGTGVFVLVGSKVLVGVSVGTGVFV